MNIANINPVDHLVSFSRATITVKDRKTGKTAGLVKDAIRISPKTSSPRQVIDVRAKLRAYGIDCSLENMDRVILHDGQVYLFRDMRLLDCRDRMPDLFAVDDHDGRMTRRIEADNIYFEAAHAAGISVIEYMPLRESDRHNYR